MQGLRENQAKGIMKAPGIDMDEKDFGIGAQILRDFQQNAGNDEQRTKKARQINVGYGLEIVEYVPIK